MDSQLYIKENTGRLPAPYSEQLVEEILHDKVCICGRPVCSGTAEEGKIRNLLRNASTTGFNSRIRVVQFLLKEIQNTASAYEETLRGLNQVRDSLDAELHDIDLELKGVNSQLRSIDEHSIKQIEEKRIQAKARLQNVLRERYQLDNTITKNRDTKAQLQAEYDRKAKTLGHGDSVRKEIDKIKRVRDYIINTLGDQERRSLNIFRIQLANTLDRYLTKHYLPRVNPETYEVDMLDTQGRPVGQSTGEGQVLKFAFITTVIALAGKKTQEKISFLAEPMVAPLVLDAPFSALDPQYQSSVAHSLAAQTNQLVLLLSSANWSEAVAAALDPFVGKRYVMISHQKGPRGDKPVKTMVLGGRTITLNEYSCPRDETLIKRFA